MDKKDVIYVDKIFNESISMTFFTSHQKSEKAKTWIEHILDSYRKNGFGMWLCFLKENEKFVGQCGLMKNDIGGNEEIELGYSILRKYWNRGYASEAAQACLNYGFKKYEIQRIVSLIEKENVASLHVSEKIGMKKKGLVKRGENMTGLFSIEKFVP